MTQSHSELARYNCPEEGRLAGKPAVGGGAQVGSRAWSGSEELPVRLEGMQYEYSDKSGDMRGDP